MKTFKELILEPLAKRLFVVEDLDDIQESAKRIGTCKSNAGKCYNADLDMCNKCKCIMNVKTKSKTFRTSWGEIRHTHCPLGLWGRADKIIANFYRSKDGLKPLK